MKQHHPHLLATLEAVDQPDSNARGASCADIHKGPDSVKHAGTRGNCGAHVRTEGCAVVHPLERNVLPTRISDSRLIVACYVIINLSANHLPDVNKVAQLVSSNKFAFLICSAEPRARVLARLKSQDIMLCY